MEGAGSSLVSGRVNGKASVSSKLAQRGYHWFAPVYDYVFGATLQQGRKVVLEALDCRPGDRVLDVCVGSGLSLPLYPSFVRVAGVDISREMLRKAAARTIRRRLAHVEGVLQMDAERLAFADDSFDKAAILYAVSGLPNPARAMKEIQRVCRPGATIVVASHFATERTLDRAFEQALSPVYRFLQYRTDLDLDDFVESSQLDVVELRRANLFGYSTILVCRNRDKSAGTRPGEAAIASSPG